MAIPSGVVFRDEVAQTRIGTSERGLIGKKNDAYVPGSGSLAEPGTMDHENVLLHQQLLHELFVAIGNIKLRKRVKRAARRNAAHVGNRIAGFHRQIAADAQLVTNFHQMILRPFQRGAHRKLLRMV